MEKFLILTSPAPLGRDMKKAPFRMLFLFHYFCHLKFNTYEKKEGASYPFPVNPAIMHYVHSSFYILIRFRMGMDHFFEFSLSLF